MSNRTVFGSGPKRDEDDDEDERPAGGSSSSAPFASRQQFGRSEERKTGNSPSSPSSAGSGGQRPPVFGSGGSGSGGSQGGSGGSGGFSSRPGDPARPGSGTGSFPRPGQGSDRGDRGERSDREERSGSGTASFGRPFGSGGSGGSGGPGSGDRPSGGTGGFPRPSGAPFGGGDRDRDKDRDRTGGPGSKPADKDEKSGGGGGLFSRPPGDRDKDKDKDRGSSKPADKDDKAGGGLGGVLGRLGRGDKGDNKDKKDDAKAAPAKLGPAGGKPDDRGKKDAGEKQGGGLGGLLGGLRRGGDESGKKPDAAKPTPLKGGAPGQSGQSGEQKGGGFLNRLGRGADKKEEPPKPGAPAPLKSPGAAKPADKPGDKPQGGPLSGIGGLLNRNRGDAPKDADKDRGGAPKIGTGPLGGGAGSGTGGGTSGASGFQPRATGQMPTPGAAGKPGGPAAIGGAKPDAKADSKAPAKAPDKGKAAGAGGGGIGARLGSLFRRGGTGAGTALVSQAPAVAPPKGAAAKPGAMPPARLDRQAKPLDYSQTQVAVRHHGLSLDQKLDLLGYALLIAAAVIIFGLLQPNEGTITTAIVNVLGGFFGAARYIIPMPVLAIGAWLLIRHFKENPFIELDILRIIGMVLMFLTLVTTLHFVQMLTVVVYSWEELTEVSARFVDLQWGGGWVGDRLYYILLRISGEYGIAALLIAAWVVSIMLTFEITLAEVSTYVKSAASWVRRKRTGFGEWRQVRQEAAVIRREAQAKARAEREAQKAARAAGPVSIERPVAGAIPAAATLGAGAAGGIAALGDRPAQATGAPGEPARLTATPAAARFNTAPTASPTPVAEATAAPAATAATAATADGPASLRPAPVAQRNRSMTMPAAPPAEPAPEPAKEDTPLPTPVARPAPMPIGSRTASKPAPESVKAPEPEPDDDLEPVKPVIAARPAPLGIRAKDEDKAALPAAPAPAAPNAAASSAQKPPSQPQSHPPAARPASPLFGKAPSPPAAPPAAPSEKPAEQPTEPEPDAQDTRPLERTGPMAAAGPASSGARPSPFKPLGKEADADKPAEKRDADSPPARVAALGPRPASGMGGSEPATKADTPDPADAAKLGKPAERPAGGLFGQRPAATGSGPFSRPAASKPATPAGDAGDDETEVAPSEPPARSPILGARPSPFSKPSAMPDAAGPDKADKTEDVPARPATLGSQPFGARPAPVEPRPGVSTGTFGAARPAPKPGQSTPAPVEEPDDTPEPDDDLKYEPLDAEAPADPADVAAGPVPPAPVVSSTPRPPTFVSGAARPSPFSPFGKRSTGSTPAAATETTGDAADTGAHKPLPAPIPSRANPFKPATPASKPAPGDDLDDDALNGDNGEDSGDENGDEVAVMPTDLPSEPVLHISEVKESGYEPPKERMGWDMPDYRALLEKGSQAHIQEEALRQRAKIIEDTLEAFGAPGRVVVTNPGPVITQFGVEPGYLQGRGKTTRVKVGAIAKLDDDLALALSARSIRIEAPVPGKSYVGIEVPNAESALVGLRDIVASTAFDREKFRLPIALGKSVDGTPIVADLTQMPHLLIAGTTGSGKSVCVNAIISCLLLENTPDDLQMIMVDPKRVELTGYNGIPHLVSPVVVDLERIVGVLKWVTREMEDRYKKFSATGARNIVDYNGKIGPHDKRMPYLVVVVDELADLMMLAPDETEKVLTRLAQMARATGIHLIISTQRPSVDVVTGLIKANFPARISFAVASSVDSRVVLDQPGAEKLLGRGDMLYQAPDAAAPVRMQGVYVSDNEINRITRHWKEATLNRRETKPPASLSVSSSDTGRPMGGGGGDALKPNPARLGSIAVSGSRSPFNEQAFFNAIREPEKNDDDLNGEDDDLYQEAVDAFQAMGKISISLLQRRLRIGFNRAARLIDLMKQRGVLGASDVAEPDSDGEE